VNGTCKILSSGSAGDPSCSPYVCNGSSAACPATCSGDFSCASGYYCNATSACAAKLAQGTACTASNQCLSSNCVDGYCCNTACQAICMACSAAKTGGSNGTCANVTASTDPDNECTFACSAGACQTGKRVFVTKNPVDADFGGAVAGDALCQGFANAQGLGGSWKSWTSDGVSSPATRFTHATVPYRLIDGTLVANNWTDLVDATIQHAIDMAQDGTTVGASKVWTGTKPDGTSKAKHCVAWTQKTSTFDAEVGSNNATNATWTDLGGSETCDGNNIRLYCFEQ
jgi:hypothetical protein